MLVLWGFAPAAACLLHIAARNGHGKLGAPTVGCSPTTCTFLVCCPAADNVYITSLQDQNTQQFVEELQRRLRAAAAAAGPTVLASGPSGMFLSQSVANLSGKSWRGPAGSVGRCCQGWGADCAAKAEEGGTVTVCALV